MKLLAVSCLIISVVSKLLLAWISVSKINRQNKQMALKLWPHAVFMNNINKGGKMHSNLRCTYFRNAFLAISRV